VSLGKLAAEMYARGLSTRDIEDLLKQISEDGQTPLLSRSSVSRVTEVLRQEYEAFAKRDLSAFDVVYLFADAVHESPSSRPGARRRCWFPGASCGTARKCCCTWAWGTRGAATAGWSTSGRW